MIHKGLVEEIQDVLPEVEFISRIMSEVAQLVKYK